MNIETRDENGVAVVLLTGEMDTMTSPEAEKFLGNLQQEGKNKILLNLEKLDFISSAGLRVLLATAQNLKGEGGELRVSNLNPDVKEVFDISGFSTLLMVFENEAKGLANF
ncbi:STAS domain-containing protein [Desulforhopalus sp. 52FAK]